MATPRCERIERFVARPVRRFGAKSGTDNKHLLKAPFCIHPSTQRVCVPVNPANINAFDFEKVPRVKGIIEQPDSMEPYLQQFKSYAYQLRAFQA